MNNLEELEFLFKKQEAKGRYADLEMKISYFEESFIRTSFGNDGNDDGNWDDENAIGTF